MVNTVIIFLMFALLIAFILMNIPVAFAFYFTAILFALMFWGWQGIFTVLGAAWSMMMNWVMVAVPLFVFMAALLEKGGVAEDIFVGLSKLVGTVRGSLAVVAVLFGYVFGAMSGAIAGSIAAAALLIYPSMIKQGYDKYLSIGAILGGGILPQIVPPSINMIIYGSEVGVSVAKLFRGGLGAGTLMALLYATYILIWSNRHKDRVPVAGRGMPLSEKLSAIKDLAPPLVIIIGVLGSIFLGLATPTEAAGVGAFLSFLFLVARRRFTLKGMKESLITTLKITALVGWTISGGRAFSMVFDVIGGRTIVEQILLSLPAARITALALSLVLLFILGMLVDNISIIVIMGPILGPIMVKLGYDPYWWGVVFCSMLQTAFLTPPVGFGLYFFKGAVPKVSMEDIIKASIPFTILTALAVVLLLLIPQYLTWFIG
ncbi:MAG: hypothetical protein DRO09_00315 [Thermoprotei archaeon]|nr:MAG: hypothetical protein DRO09_00315 [Thermoprotei archaeon]